MTILTVEAILSFNMVNKDAFTKKCPSSKYYAMLEI